MVQFIGWKPGIFLSLRIQPSLCVPCRLGRFTRETSVPQRQKCHTEDHQSSWPDSGTLLRHHCGISVVESCETSQAARRRDGLILFLNQTESLISGWSRDQVMQFQSLSFPWKAKKLGNWKRVCLLSNMAWLMAHSFENVYDFIPVSESKGGEKRLAEAVFK